MPEKATQTINGKAFEWAVADALASTTGFLIHMDRFAQYANECYQRISTGKRSTLIRAATSAATHLLDKEASVVRAAKQGAISINSDAAGQVGDVRDVLMTCGKKTIGFSCKANHEALKHSRLSAKVDFVKIWGLDEEGCSPTYWETIKPLFLELKEIRSSSHNTALWKSLPDKAEKYYWPLLDAWGNEILRITSISPEKTVALCRAFIEYLIGKQDFYKIICHGQRSVNIQAYNFHKSLSTRATPYPSIIQSINNVNGGSYSKTITFNRGFSVNFRIHNASSKVEPSLKFDINAVGLPTEVYQHAIEY